MSFDKLTSCDEVSGGKTGGFNIGPLSFSQEKNKADKLIENIMMTFFMGIS